MEQVENRVQADRSALIVAVALGAEVDIPVVGDELAAFHDRLFAEPVIEDMKRRRLRAALGVA